MNRFRLLILFGVISFGLFANVAHAQASTATLSWVAPVSSPVSVTSYNVYRSTITGGPYTKLNLAPIAGLTYADTTVVAGNTYFYVIRSLGSNNVESANSSQVSANLNAPTAPGSVTITITVTVGP